MTRPVGLVEVLRIAQALIREGEHARALQRVAVLVRVGRDRRDAGHREVEGWDVVAELTTEGEDETAETTVDVQSDAVLECDRPQVADRVDRAVTVIRRRPDQRHGIGVDVATHPIEVDRRGHRIDRRDTHLHAEEVAGLGEGGMGGLGLDHVGTGGSRRVGFAVGEHGVGDRPRSARRDHAGRVGAGHGVGVQHIEGHGDDLGLELRRTRTHIALERVHVREVAERLVEEVVVVVVTAVHGARALAVFPDPILALGDVVHHREDLFSGGALVRHRTVDRIGIGVGKVGHGVSCAWPYEA